MGTCYCWKKIVSGSNFLFLNFKKKTPFLVIPPPPWGGTVTWPQRHRKYLAPKLISAVILWYSFVVQPPPPPKGGTVTS